MLAGCLFKFSKTRLLGHALMVSSRQLPFRLSGAPKEGSEGLSFPKKGEKEKGRKKGAKKILHTLFFGPGAG